MVINVEEENFEENILYSDIPVVVDFWGKWCGPCLAFAPTFKRLSKKYKGQIRFLKCNVGKNRAIANLFDVKSIPTILFFCNGEIQDRTVGKYDAEKLEGKLRDVLERCHP